MDEIKKSWSNLAKNEKIGLITGTVCYVMVVGVVLCVAEALFFWNRNRRQALFVGITGPVMFVTLLIMMLTGRF